MAKRVKLRMIRRISRAKLADKELRKEVWRAVVDTAKAIETYARAGAPVDDGDLRRSYKTRFFKEKLRAVVVARRDIAPHAMLVEFGTKKMTAQPHLRPAARGQRKQFFVRISQAMNRASLRKWAGA